MPEAQPQCIFCMIRDKQTPSVSVYEDDLVMVVFDKYPATKGHLIVIPKKHVNGLHELDDEETGRLFVTCKNIIFAQTQVLGCEGINMVYSLGEIAGQRSPHMIVHLIPRFKEDQVSIIWNPTQVPENELKDAFEKLSKALKDVSIPVIREKEPRVIEEAPEPKQEEVIEKKPRIPSY